MTTENRHGGNGDPGAEVVVGVDGSPGSRSALEFALRDAARRGARLRVVTAVRPPEYWASPYGPIPVPPTPAKLDDVAADVRRLVGETTARLGVEVPVEVTVDHGSPAPVLLDAAAGAALLVLGHRGRGVLAGAVLGSVGLRCVLHADCPVTVVRPDPVPATASRPRRSGRSTAVRRSTVAEVMTTAVRSVPPTASFAEVARVLAEAGVRAVPVVALDGLLLGVVSEADLLVTLERSDAGPARQWWRPRHVHRGRFDPKVGATTAAALMSAAVRTVTPGESVAAAARAMREHGLSWMPVVDGQDRVVGVLGRSDLLAVFHRGDEELRAEIVDEVIAPLTDPARVRVGVREGVVTLQGELETRGDTELAVVSAERVEGVVAVVDLLGHRVDERLADAAAAPRY